MKYLSEEFIATIDKFNLRARLIVEGFIIGLHKSPYHGFSVEFSDHRQYNPGDPISKLDWKVYARTNRYYIRRYEEETNLKILHNRGSQQFHEIHIRKNLEDGICQSFCICTFLPDDFSAGRSWISILYK